jgi:23S rRNA pseudouridine2605 synthase
MEEERIAKYLARAGIASRREVERMITAGRVKLNGKLLETPATLVCDGDRIEVDGELVGGKPATRMWRFHKPAGLMTTARDPQGRPTVFDALPKDWGRVISVGRLDLNSEGLLLITNDGALARHLELPATGLKRCYRVRVHGIVTPATFAALKKGMEVEGIQYGPIEATFNRPAHGKNAWLDVTLTEGKNREIRKVMNALDLDVNRLIRLSYGPYELGALEPGESAEIPATQLPKLEA